MEAVIILHISHLYDKAHYKEILQNALWKGIA